MKRSWSTILLITGLAGLLVVLGGLQYRWLSQISESDGEKAQKRVQDQADQFAADFNREIQGAYFNFQADAVTWKNSDWNEFNKRYEFWREKTAYPELITDFYFFQAYSDAAPLRFDRTSRSFVTTEMTPELAALRDRFSDEKTFRSVYDDSLTFVLPIHDDGDKIKQIMMRTRSDQGPVLQKAPPKFGYLAIKLDPATIKDKLLPDLTAKHFGDGEFRMAVVGKDGQPVFQSIMGDSADATAPLLDLSTDNFMFFANKDLMSSLKSEKEPGEQKRAEITLNSKVETHSFNRIQTTNNDNGTVKIEVKRESTPRTSVFTAMTKVGPNTGPWTLQVQHSSGSLGAYLTGTLRRNLAIGFGILFLLAAAIAAIIVSAQRMKMLAQRQVDFVSSVSHEFRTPLAVIYSAGENLADGVAKEDAQVSRYGDLIKGEGRKLSSMVEQILEFAGANAGRRRFNFAPTSVADVVESAVAESRSLVGDRGFEIETDIAEALPTIRADKAALSQAVENLVANSIKYCNGDAWLRVSATNGDGVVKITVEDRGIGISKSDLRQIFEPFYRSKEVVDAQIHGNGLGLSLVKQIAKAHGGRVRATSELGKGSKFTIELPM